MALASLAPSAPPPCPPSVSLVTLSQVKDILTTSRMVQALHTQINPPPASLSLSSPSAMEIDLDKSASASYSHAMSFDLWTDSHPLISKKILVLFPLIPF